MQTRDQRYAIQILKQVQAIKRHPEYKESLYKKYGAISFQLPILIHSAGLAQALAYVESRKEQIFKDFLRDLSITICKGESLCEQARNVELPEYILLSRQVLAALLWYKRFAQSILDVDAEETLEPVP
jgi:CRISPR-associated protein Cmr5